MYCACIHVYLNYITVMKVYFLSYAFVYTSQYTSSTDGLPLAPLSNPAQVEETLTTLTIVWGEALVPLNAPLQGYTITVVPVQNDAVPLELSTRDNETTIQLFNLIPGQQYRVMVFGRNSFGRGTPSATLVARTVVPLPPHQPIQVHGVVTVFETSSSINVSWMVRSMTLNTSC